MEKTNITTNNGPRPLRDPLCYLEIITAQKGVLEAGLQLTENKRNLLLASVDLYRSLGGGWQ